MNKKKIFFISDLHFGHANIINLCSRPFSSADEMNAALISNWNSAVGSSDTVYIVGDMFFTSQDPAPFLRELNGEKILITGNHDGACLKKHRAAYDFFSAVTPYLEINESCHPITLCHYPMLEWNKDRRHGSGKLGYLIYGHIHNNILPEYKILFMRGNALNAGADINGFTPVTFRELVRNNEEYRLSVFSSHDDRARFICGARCMQLSDADNVPLTKIIESLCSEEHDVEKATEFRLACAIRYGGFDIDSARRFFGEKLSERALALSKEKLIESER